MIDLPPATPRLSRRLRWLLGLSLALNLIFVGFVAGAAWRFREGPPDGAAIRRSSYAVPYLQALERPQQRAIRRAIRAGERPLAGREQLRADYAQILAALRSDSFDATSVQSILETQSRNLRQVQDRAQAKWVEIVESMSLAERRAYADRLEEVLQRRTRRGKPGD